MLVVEEIKIKTEENMKNDLKVAEQILKPNKKSLAWTVERKAKQALRIAELRGKGKTYTGKKLKITEQHNDDKTDSTMNDHIVTSPQGGDPGVESESDERQEGVSPIVVFAIIFIAVTLAVLVFFKDSIIEIISGDKNDER